jgi:hypothetical protein
MQRSALWVSLFAMQLLVASSAFGQPWRSKETIFAFGNWRIELIKENRSLQLIGVVTKGEGAYFVVQCYAEGDQLMILVPTFDNAEIAAARRRSFVQVTVWNEQGKPAILQMGFYKDAAGMTIGDKSKLVDPYIWAQAFIFLEKLREAKTFFAFEAGGATRTYDAKHLGAARTKFEESCAEIRKDWEGFVARM